MSAVFSELCIFQARKKLSPNSLKDLLLPVVPLDTDNLVKGIVLHWKT